MRLIGLKTGIITPENHVDDRWPEMEEEEEEEIAKEKEEVLIDGEIIVLDP